MKRLWIAPLAAALMIAGCGDSETDAPGDRESAPIAGANPFLSRVDADTSYVYANLQRLPDSFVDNIWAMNDAAAGSNEALFDALADDEEIPAEFRALLEEVKMLSTREGWEAAGLHSNPYYAVYGVSLLPFIEFELADGAAFAELIGRIEAGLEQPLERRDVGGRQILWFELLPDFGIALDHDEDSVTGAMIPDDAAMLARVADADGVPAEPLDAETLDAFNRETGFSRHGSGFVDWRRFVDTMLGGESALARLFHDDQRFAALTDNPACVDEYANLTGALPRLVFGYTRLDDDNADILVRQETSAELAGKLKPIARAPVAIDRELNGLFNFGFALDLVEARNFARSLVDAWIDNPPQCPSFAWITENAPDMQQALNRPIPPVVTNLNGLYLEAESLELADDGMPTGGGTLSLFMRNPQLLTGMAQMFSPAVAELELRPGQEPKPVPEGAIPQLDQAGLKGWIAMGENALGIAIGEDNVDALTRAIEPTDADDLLLAGRFDFRIFLELIDMAEATLGEMPDDDAALGLETQRAQYEAMAAVYDRAAFKLRLGDEGIDFVAESKLK